MSTQKELDLEVADRLENFVTSLSERYSMVKEFKDNLDEVEYLNIVSALRYAIATLRSTNYEVSIQNKDNNAN